MECGSTLTLVSLYFVPSTLFWDGSLLLANFSSLRRSNMISNLSFISSSNRFAGYCVSTPVCCGLVWLNFIVISKHRSYLNVSIFQEEITPLSLWNGKTVVIFISPVLHSESYYPKMITNDDTCYDENSNFKPTETTAPENLKQIIHNLHPPEPSKLAIDPFKNSRLLHS